MHLSDVKAIRAALGGTVNDVVLTVVSGGLRELLEARGETSTDATIRALVPVSVRRPGEPASTTTACRRCSPSCPWGSTIRSRGSSRCARRWTSLKQSKQAVAGDVLTSLSGFAPPMLLALGGRLAARSPSLGVQTGVTNVPGPQQPAADARAQAARVVPVRPADRQRANLDRDLLLQRRPLLRRHRRLRQLERHRRPDRGRRAWTGRTAQDEPAAGTRTGIQAGKAEEQGPRRGVSRGAANPACVMPSRWMQIQRGSGRDQVEDVSRTRDGDVDPALGQILSLNE